MRRPVETANYPYHVTLDTAFVHGRDVETYALTLNNVLSIEFVPLGDAEAEAFGHELQQAWQGEQTGFFDEPMSGFWVFPLSGEQHSNSVTPTEPEWSDEERGTHVFLVPRDTFQWFLGELNAMMLTTKPEGHGILDVDRLKVVRFVSESLLKVGYVRAGDLKLVAIQGDG